ncbi:MAG: peptide deformylase [Solirubrobacterales bacterium]|jgi:peptide deformylase
MSILKVARLGHPVLRATARDLTRQEIRSPEIQRLIDDMRVTMYEYEGVGLAAPQVHESLRLAVIEVQSSDDRARSGVPFTVLVNPKVTPLGEETVGGWEGCLSIPDLRGLVPRLKHLKLEALDRHGKPYTLEAEGFHARVIQHECDHLDGHVYIDRMRGMGTFTFIKEFEDHVLRGHGEDDPE